MAVELRFLTFSFDDPEAASCLDVSPTLKEARAMAPRGATYCYDVKGDELIHERFVEVRGGCRRRLGVVTRA